MAEIGPFRGWRYSSKAGKLENLTSPLFEFSEIPEWESNKNPYNIIHLSLNKELKDAEEKVISWKKNKILIQDSIPGIYVYEQIFKDRHNHTKHSRGFICNLKLQDWAEGVVLRHEATIPHSVKHREEMLQATAMHICPVHGLYTDENLVLEKYINGSLENPFYKFYDSGGILNIVSVIQDLSVIKLFINTLKNKPIIIADGHHRYEAALNNHKKHLSNGKIKASDFIPIFLTNTESNDLEIYPTHRAISGIRNFSSEDFINNLKVYFRVETIEDVLKLDQLVQMKKHSFGIILKDRYLLITLRDGLEKTISWNFPEIIKDLDLTILHYFVLEKVLNIKGKDQINSKNINFSRKFNSIISDISDGLLQIGIITKEVSKEEIKNVCYSGYTLPQKSTYFYPKVLCGLILGSIKEEEFSLERKLYSTDLNL